MREKNPVGRRPKHLQQWHAARRIAVGLASTALMWPGLQAAAAGPSACASLGAVAIPNTTITSATYVADAGGNYCQVAATVAPEHDVQVRLPDLWKQRYVQNGGAGFDGAVPNAGAATGSGGRNLMADGFVVTADNGGHRATLHPGASFANDRTLTLSYATAKIFDTNMVAKALMQTYYGQQPAHRYFAGCSNGGKNASVAAANFADYFDGILGAAGVWGHATDNVGGTDMASLTTKWSHSVQWGAITPQKAANLQAKTMAACDALDGVADGIISNPGSCPFKAVAAAERCSGGENGTCLTDLDIDRVNAHTSDVLLNGRTIGAAWSATANMSQVAGTALPTGFLQMAFRSATPINPLTYDIPKQFVDVAAVLDGVYSMTGSLDGILQYLRRDKKLILFHGWDDTTVPAFNSINFFDAVRKTDDRGDRRDAKQNLRLYMGAGVGHCQGGQGADSQELLYVLAKWVEGNAAPGSASNPVLAWKRAAGAPADIGGAAFTRPLCPYPQYAQYVGGRRGDPAQASSYACRRD